jgi:hypothetical protein
MRPPGLETFVGATELGLEICVGKVGDGWMEMSVVNLGIGSPAAERASCAGERDEVKFCADVDAKPGVGVTSLS